MKVFISSPLHSYTGNQAHVQAEGDTVRSLLADLDRRYPGIRFRLIDEQDEIREHIRIFVNDERVRDLATALQPDDRVHIITSVSGG